MPVASSGQMPGLSATAPHSPCLCSSTKPEQPKSPSTSRSLAGPGKGWGKKKSISLQTETTFLSTLEQKVLEPATSEA